MATNTQGPARLEKFPKAFNRLGNKINELCDWIGGISGGPGVNITRSRAKTIISLGAGKTGSNNAGSYVPHPWKLWPGSAAGTVVLKGDNYLCDFIGTNSLISVTVPTSISVSSGDYIFLHGETDSSGAVTAADVDVYSVGAISLIERDVDDVQTDFYLCLGYVGDPPAADVLPYTPGMSIGGGLFVYQYVNTHLIVKQACADGLPAVWPFPGFGVIP